MSTNGTQRAENTVIEIRSIRRGQQLFASDGYTHVKVTKGGTVQVLQLPIRSQGLTEILDELRKGAPEPPYVSKHVTHDSPVGRQLRLANGERQWVYMYDLTDEKYKRELEEYNRLMTMETIHRALVVEFFGDDGQPIIDRDEKIKVLEEQGISPQQFTQIMADITRLTELTDADREAFFAKS